MMNTTMFASEDFDPRALPEQAVLYAHLLTRDAMRDEGLRLLMVAPRFSRRQDGAIPFPVLKDMHKHQWSIVRAWREHLEIKRQALAARLDMSIGEYELIERGLVALMPALLDKIAQAMGLDVSQLELSHYPAFLQPFEGDLD